MSIKSNFLGAIGLLAGSAILLSSWLAVSQSVRLHEAGATVESTAALTVTAGLIDTLGSECKNYELTLLHHSSIGAVSAFRRATNDSFRKAYSILARLDRPETDQWLDQVLTLERRLAELRHFVDQQPDEQAIAAKAATLISMSSPASELTEIVTTLEAPASEYATAAGRSLMEIGAMAYHLRLQAINAALLTDQLASSGQPTPDMLEDFYGFRASVETDWGNILRLLRAINGDPDTRPTVEGISAAIHAAQTIYFNDTVAFENNLVRDLVSGRPVSARAPDLFQKHQIGISTLKIIRDKAFTGALDLARRSEQQAQRGLWTMIGLVLSLAGVVSFLWLTVRRQVVLPMVALTEIILRLARDDRQLTVPERHRQDEIGRLAEAIDILRRNADHAAAMERQRRQMEVQLRNAQKLEALGTLASGVAHEMNTPIQYLGDNVRFLETGFDDLMTIIDTCVAPEAISLPAAERQQVITKVCEQADLPFLRQEVPSAFSQSLSAVEQIRDIIQAVNDFTQPGHSDLRLTDINQAIQTTLTLCRAQWAAIADFDLHLAADLPLVLCMAAEINQVLLHLIDNGIQAIADKDQGRGTLTITTGSLPAMIEIQIADSGIGMTADIIERIFEPFFTTRAPGRGTGQGLSVCHGIVVHKHGGTIDVKSLPGVGTTVTLRLPLTPQGHHQPAAPADMTG